MSARGGGAALFAFGSLQIAEVMEAVTGTRFPGRPAVLPGHRRRRLRGLSYPGLLPDPDEETDGVLFCGLGVHDLRVLDLFEGDGYDRREAEVVLHDGTRRTAFVYVTAAHCAHRLSDQVWSVDAFRATGLADFLETCRAFRRGADPEWDGPG